ncbi:MAG: FadR family transcriptional regulator [Alphaproteobacteria bacterium]|nr:FadR/GntR family transcriptional regulator [Alphaproteobacteria bacterium]TAD91405.1 MAG: FadR family transcriptional regulator [Alphaproteobacteria bacterium]
MKRTTRRQGDVVDTLAAWIMGGRYPASAGFPTEPEICAELGVSRTVVREAVKTLVAKGLLVTGPRVGTRVRPVADWQQFDSDVIRWQLAGGVTAEFVRDIIDLRLLLEPGAARLAAERRSERDLAELDAALDGMTRAVADGGSGTGYLEADLAFHEGILRATGNPFVLGMLPVVDTVLRVSFRQSVKSRASAASSLPFHREVRDAIADRDGAAAEVRLRSLITAAEEDITSDLETDDFLKGGLP